MPIWGEASLYARKRGREKLEHGRCPPYSALAIPLSKEID